jgi:hypothetical protein
MMILKPEAIVLFIIFNAGALGSRDQPKAAIRNRAVLGGFAEDSATQGMTLLLRQASLTPRALGRKPRGLRQQLAWQLHDKINETPKTSGSDSSIKL